MTDSQAAVENPTPAERPQRAALYVDGFNLFHALKDLGEPHLKWLDLVALGRLIIPQRSEELVSVVYCSAYYPGDSQKRWRHDMYLNSLRIRGVRPAMGHYVTNPMDCRSCGAAWDAPTEKEGDINVAIHLINDAWRGLYDHAYLLSADSDQAATTRLFKTQFPHLKITAVSPPNRNFSYDVTRHCTGKIALDKTHIERCLLPSVVMAKDGSNNHGRRPREYDPPEGWTAPSQQ